MKKRVLGSTGLEASEIGIGTAVFGLQNYLIPWAGSDDMDRRARETISRALDLGCNYIDTAAGYGDSEERLGRVLPGNRDGLILATKIIPDDWTPNRVRRSVERSLSRLRTDCLDVVQFHGGSYFNGDEDAILGGGAAEELSRLRDEGKVKFLGFTAESPSGGAQRLLESGLFDVMQIQYNIMYQAAHDIAFNAGFLPMAREAGIGVVTMRTVTSGRFQRLAEAALPELSPDRVSEIALRYVLSNPLVDVALVGMTSPEMAEANIRISEDGVRYDLSAIHEGQVHGD